MIPLAACGPGRVTPPGRVSWVSTTAPAQLDADRTGRGAWREIVDPERRLGVAYRQDGLLRLVRAITGEDAALGGADTWVLLDQALIRFDRARRRLPDDPELAFYTAYALGMYERRMPDGSTDRRVDEAVDAWHRVREIDPAFFPDRVALELAQLHMRRGEFAVARAAIESALSTAVPATVDLLDRFFIAAAFERALALMFGPVDSASVHGNLAEAAMLTGDLPAAVEHYRASAADAQGPLTRVLAWWGLAVALERSGAHDDALRAASQAIREDPLSASPDHRDLVDAHGPLAVLHLPFVFFEPRWEIHAYEALGHEAMGRAESGAAHPEEELRRALVSWRLFLADGGVASRYAPIARRGIERLEAETSHVAPPRRAPRSRQR